MPLGTTEHSLDLRQGLVTTEEQQDLVKLGIARNTREEQTKARDARLSEVEHPKMAALYREHILGEKPTEPLVQLQVRKKPETSAEEPTVSGEA